MTSTDDLGKAKDLLLLEVVDITVLDSKLEFVVREMLGTNWTYSTQEEITSDLVFFKDILQDKFILLEAAPERE